MCGDARAATVTVGEDRKGPCGMKMANLAPGPHLVVVRWGKRTWKSEAVVKAASTVQISVDWADATEPAPAPVQPQTTQPKRLAKAPPLTTGDWLVVGGVVVGALVLGAGVAYAIEQPGRVEVPSTSLGERTVLQK
jgi:hypothetical protein